MDYRRTSDRTRQARTQQPRTEPQAPRRTMIPVPPPAPPTVPLAQGAHAPRPTPDLALYDKPYDYSTPPVLDALAVDLTLAEEETEYLRSAAQIADLLRSWLKRPTFDPEYAWGVERYAGEIAAWHDAQLKRKAEKMGCSARMILILEELVRCFIDERRPDGILARRLLMEY